MGSKGIKCKSEIYFTPYPQCFHYLKCKLLTKSHKALQDLASGYFRFDHIPCHSLLLSLLSEKMPADMLITHARKILPVILIIMAKTQFLKYSRSSNHILCMLTQSSPQPVREVVSISHFMPEDAELQRI